MISNEIDEIVFESTYDTSYANKQLMLLVPHALVHTHRESAAR